MAFKKGKSGNPGGQTKDEVKFRADFKEALIKRAGGAEGLAKKLWDVVEFASEHSVKFAAFKESLDRIFGKPSQQLEVEVSGTIELATAVEKARKRAKQARG